MEKSQTTNKKSKRTKTGRNRSVASDPDEDFAPEEHKKEESDNGSSYGISESESEAEKPIPKIAPRVNLRNVPREPAQSQVQKVIVPEKPSLVTKMEEETNQRVSRARVTNRTAAQKPKTSEIVPKKAKVDQHKATNVLSLATQMMEDKKRLTYKDKFDQAMNHLQENYVPEELPCRDKEKRIIHDFIESGLRNKGNSQTLCRVVLIRCFRGSWTGENCMHHGGYSKD